MCNLERWTVTFFCFSKIWNLETISLVGFWLSILNLILIFVSWWSWVNYILVKAWTSESFPIMTYNVWQKSKKRKIKNISNIRNGWLTKWLSFRSHFKILNSLITFEDNITNIEILLLWTFSKYSINEKLHQINN